MNTFSVKNEYFFLCFSLPFAPKQCKHAHPKLRLLNPETCVSGNFKNRANENAQVNSENEYSNEYGGLLYVCQQSCVPSTRCLIYSPLLLLVTVQLHHPSKQIRFSCLVPLALKAYCSTCIDSAQVALLLREIVWVLFNNDNHVHGFWIRHIGLNAAPPVSIFIHSVVV